VLVASCVVLVMASWMIQMLSSTGEYAITSTNPNLTLTTNFIGGSMDTTDGPQTLTDTFNFDSPVTDPALVSIEVTRDNLMPGCDYIDDCVLSFEMNNNSVIDGDEVMLNYVNDVELQLDCVMRSCPQDIGATFGIALIE